jgi:hypothetical protein
MASISLYDTTIGVANHSLLTLLDLLDKVKAHPEADSLVSARLYPDMLPFSTQILIVCSFAKKMVERLAARELEAWSDDDITKLDQLVERVHKTLDLLKTVKKEDVDGREQKEQTIKMGPLDPVQATTAQYVLGYALPNLFFHLTTAYDILRMKGVQLGKADYLKHFVSPFMPAAKQ